ncbi:hypothetical protein CEXT_220151 [Caerostris extrusa]|uniref:Uncharacterized protein n=1 Tax=Caerostris extrusa TaxID=172846 RepID=A0AAV4MNQ4_CAEEX|nr:hypothetical protein CEXT_220151 [Caerostris extrusa]
MWIGTAKNFLIDSYLLLLQFNHYQYHGFHTTTSTQSLPSTPMLSTNQLLFNFNLPNLSERDITKLLDKVSATVRNVLRFPHDWAISGLKCVISSMTSFYGPSRLIDFFLMGATQDTLLWPSIVYDDLVWHFLA